MPGEQYTTSISLLEHIRKQDEDGWKRFVAIYSPLVFHWCVNDSRLPPEDANDIVQEVFTSVATGISNFSYEQPGASFRGWLRVITRNRIRNLIQRKQSSPAADGGSAAMDRIKELPAEIDEQSSELEHQIIVRQTLDLIKSDFSEQTWQAFERYCLQNHSTEEIAESLQMSAFAVRQACYRVRQRLRQELTPLLNLDAPAAIVE